MQKKLPLIALLLITLVGSAYIIRPYLAEKTGNSKVKSSVAVKANSSKELNSASKQDDDTDSEDSFFISDDSADYGNRKNILQTSDPFLNRFYNIASEKLEEEKELSEKEKEILVLKENDYEYNDLGYAKAIESGDEINLVRFIFSGKSPTKLESDNNSTLYYAIKSGKPVIFDLLLKQGADINYINTSSQNILIQAIEQGYSQMIPKIISSRINLMFVDNSGWSALHYAIDRKDLKSVFLLIKNAPGLLNYKNKNGNTPLLLTLDKAYKNKDKELLVLAGMLLKKEKYLNITNAVGNTALHFSTLLNNYKLTKIILEKGANPNLENVKGWRPIDIAVKNKDVDMINLLRYYGAKM
ncbi:MAG: hypothetical protein GY793_07610 [Proteobacteria bacterium]|nr:hypothetical protein [Pseudomonadota bacterium]